MSLVHRGVSGYPPFRAARTFALALLGWIGLEQLPAQAQVATALIKEGDALGGGLVNSINNPSVNYIGGFSVQVNTSDGLSHIWGNAGGGSGALLVNEGTYGNYLQTAFESFNGFSDAGQAAYSPTCTEISSGLTGLDAVWVDTTPILVERQPVPSMAGQFSVFNSRAGISGKGDVHWVGGISTVQGGATQNRVLFFGNAATPLLKGGDIIGGVALPHTTGNMDFDYRFSRLGKHYIIEAQVTSGSTTNDQVMVVDGNAVVAGGGFVREGSPVPVSVGGLPGENWAIFDNQGITEFGRVFVTGDTSAATTVDEFVFSNGQIVQREGTVLAEPDGSYTISGAIEGGYQNRQGDWAVEWDANNPSAANIEILLVNGVMVLKEGDAVDLDGDGTVEPSSKLADFTGIASLVMGPRDAQGNATLYFTADVDTLGTPTNSGDDTEALLKLAVPITTPNQAPIAGCENVGVSAGSDCTAPADINFGSHDPDDDPLAFDQSPAGPYPLGETEVTLTVTDILGDTDTCVATVTVNVLDAPLTVSMAPEEIAWAPELCNLGYDVVRGDVGSLVASSGDFSVATLECLADDHPDTTLSYTGVPAPGAASWFLARRKITAGHGTYNSGGPGQQGSRDAEIAASGADCP